MRPQSDEASAAYGRDLRRDPVSPRKARLAQAGRAGESAEMAQTVAGLPLRARLGGLYAVALQFSLISVLAAAHRGISRLG